MKKRAPTLELISHSISKWVGTSTALLIVSFFLIGWVCSGFLFQFDEIWHLTITTSGAAISLFMIFVLTRAQAKDTLAMQLKLDEIIRVLEKADNELVNIENNTEEELQNQSVIGDKL